MTPQEMKLRITEYGPDITDQQRLIICIEHYEILKTRASKSLRHINEANAPWAGNCALCDKYSGPKNNCTRDGVACLLGIHGCIVFYRSITSAMYDRDHAAFTRAVDNMLTFLRSHLEGETILPQI